LTKATELIAKLDVPSGPSPANFRTYPLEHASSIKLSPMIQELFDTRSESTEQQSTPFLVQADEASNVLIVSGSAEDHAALKDLLEMLDVQSTLAAQFKIFPLAMAKAIALEETLTELFAQQQRRRSAAGGGATPSSTNASVVATSIVADERTNSLLVWASPSEMENISQVIEKLDKSQPTMTLMVETIRLNQALADDLAGLLTSAGIAAGEQTGGTRTSQEEARSRILQYMDLDDRGETIIRKLVQQDVTIIPEARTNSVMVIAPPDSMEMLKSFIRNLDAIKPIVNEIKVFTLLNADAEEMVETLNQLFEAEERSTRSSSTGGEPERELALQGATEGAGGRQELSFTVDARTNSVIAAGTPEYLEIVQTLILELDSQDIQERVNRVHKLKYVTSPELEPVLTSFLEAESDLLQDIEQETALQRRLTREVRVVSDEASNSLLLNFDPRQESAIMAMIDQLDQAPPQVMIQVLLAEVNLQDTLDMGLEFAVQDLLFSETAVVGPNGTLQSNDFDFIAGTDIGAAGAPNSFGGFSFSITGEDFNFLLRALQTDRRLEVLSRPSIMARDNEEASIIIGRQVPFVRNVNVTDSGQTTSSVEYEDVGISLTVTPHINPDGWVNIEVSPEISDITDSSVQISENLTSPIFTKTEASTNVTVKDGETVVIGGLITSRAEERETKVPILGDIPGLGLLFRAMAQNNEKRELLIILTPRVVRDEFSAYDLSVEERDKADLMPDSIKQNILMEKLRVEPGEDGLDMEFENDEIEEPMEKGAHAPEKNRSIYGPQKPRGMKEIQTRSVPMSEKLNDRLKEEVQKVDR
jgi:type II secretion system protein D